MKSEDAQQQREASPETPETPKGGATTVGAIVEHARSSRSTCRVCNNAIGKGQLRVGLDVQMTQRAGGHTGTVWRHLRCFKAPVGMHLDHLKGMGLLSAAEKRQVKAALAASGATEQAGRGARRAGRESARGPSEAPPKHNKAHPEEIAARGVAGKHAAAEQALHHPHPGDWRFLLTGGGSSSGRKSAVRDKYSAMSVTELKEVLRANEQMLSGTKDQLLQRCVDGEMRGGLPLCPTCHAGRLHFDDGVYHCPGYFDNDAKAVVRCDFTATKVQRNPWSMPGGATQKKPGLA